MSSSPSPSLPATQADADAAKPRTRSALPSMGVTLADACVVLLFLGLTFLLGIFPQHDTDFWWHLKTGDMIRAGSGLPRTDWFTFGGKGHSWVDLHWLFQIGLSFLYSVGGVNATIWAKCIITTIAVGLLIVPLRKGWPIWIIVLAWIPALFVLAGRMYVRPETLTLLYFAIDLAVLARIDRHLRLVWIVPVVQLFWVNTQGLFPFGPILFGMAIIDAGLRPGAFSTEKRIWWRTVMIALLLTGLACLINPYGIFGSLYPLQLVSTMTGGAFSDILELQSVPSFIAKNGIYNLSLLLHLTTIYLGAFSFLLPLLWRLRNRFVPIEPPATSAKSTKKKTNAIESAKTTKRRSNKAPEEPLWRVSPLRLMIFVGFSLLSLKATRNTHQFAAMVGAITGWNFGEWGAAIVRHRQSNGARREKSAIALLPRFATSAILAALIGIVGSGAYYTMTGEGRTVGWGEAPLWFAHDAVKFAGSPGMPSRFLTYHNGVSGLFEYHNGPEQKVFTDARLEVMGPELYTVDKQLGGTIAAQRPGWSEQIEALGPPVPGAVIDHVQPATTDLAVAFLGHPAWRCVFHDPTASVYLRRGENSGVGSVDFSARHFGLDPTSDPKGAAALSLAARNLVFQARGLIARSTNTRLAESMLLLGQGYARRTLALDIALPKAWRNRGVVEVLRIKPNGGDGEPRFRLPFDPIIDLSYVRATHDLEEASRLAPDDFETLIYLFDLYLSREMYENARLVSDRLLRLNTTAEREIMLNRMKTQLGRAQAAVRGPAKTGWANAAELDQLIKSLDAEGREKSVLSVLNGAYTAGERTWDQSDRIATIQLHLGRPDLARAAWLEATKVPRPALRDARVGHTYLVQGNFDAAREQYQAAIAIEPDLFEALYALAVLERDAGNATAALNAATAAAKVAAGVPARNAAESIIDAVRPYVRPLTVQEMSERRVLR